MTTAPGKPVRTTDSATQNRTVAIIGAGPGGLAAAVLLAASGVKVRVYEAQPTIGGRTARVQVGDYAFDKGPTFFMMPYVLEEIFAAAGRRLDQYVHLDRLDPMYRLIVGRAGKGAMTLDATQNLEEMSRRISAVNEADGRAFARFISDNRYKLRHSESILRNPMRSPLDLFGPKVWKDTLKVGPVLAPHKSVHDLLCRYFQDEHVRLAVCFQSKYLGMSPFECPSLFTILPFIEYEYGIWHPRGGCHALMRALADVATELGAEIMTDTPIAGVLMDGVRAVGVKIGGGGALSGREVRHDNVIINADASWAIKNLLPEASRRRAGAEYSAETLDAKRYSCSTWMLYAGVRGQVDLPHHTIYVSESYRRNLEDICTNLTLSDDPSVYVCNPSRTDPTLAPQGKSSLYILVPTPNCRADIDWKEAGPRLRERALEQIEARMGLSLRGRIEASQEITPADWRAANINFGATFNLAHNLGQMLHRRPQNRLRGFENVYLVGGGTHPGSGLPTIFLSAQISASMLCDELGVRFAGECDAVRKIAESREILPAAAGAH